MSQRYPSFDNLNTNSGSGHQLGRPIANSQNTFSQLSWLRTNQDSVANQYPVQQRISSPMPLSYHNSRTGSKSTKSESNSDIPPHILEQIRLYEALEVRRHSLMTEQAIDCERQRKTENTKRIEQKLILQGFQRHGHRWIKAGPNPNPQRKQLLPQKPETQSGLRQYSRNSMRGRPELSSEDERTYGQYLSENQWTPEMNRRKVYQSSQFMNREQDMARVNQIHEQKLANMRTNQLCPLRRQQVSQNARLENVCQQCPNNIYSIPEEEEQN